MKAIVRGKSSLSRAMGAHLTMLVLGVVSLLLAVSGSHADVAIIAHRSVPVDTLDQHYSISTPAISAPGRTKPPSSSWTLSFEGR